MTDLYMIMAKGHQTIYDAPLEEEPVNYQWYECVARGAPDQRLRVQYRNTDMLDGFYDDEGQRRYVDDYDYLLEVVG